MRAVAVLAASTSFLLLVVRRPGSPIGITALAILFFVGFMGAVLAWDTHWKSWRSIVRAAAASAIATGLVLALLQILPPGRSPDTTPSSTAPSPSSIATVRTSASPAPTPSASSSAAATAEPTWISSRPPTVRGEGTVKLTANSSGVIKRFHLRIAAGDLFGNSADVRVVTDARICVGSPEVGESIVMTDRLEYADDYRTWYRVVVDRIDPTEITLAWSVGSGRAPYGSEQSCGVAY